MNWAGQNAVEFVEERLGDDQVVRPVDAELDEVSAEGSGFTPRRETGRQHHGVEEQSLPTGRLDDLEPPSAPWRHSEASLLPSGSHGPP